MNLSQIELLRVLQENDFSLSKAAEKMHIVQSAVSRQLQLFEAELGSPIYERQGKKLIGLTSLGQRIMAEVATINMAKNNIQTIAADYIDSNQGVLHIATTHTQAKYFLPSPILRFREKYPGVRIYMIEASPEQLINKLHTRKADIAICTEKVDEDADLVVKPCYEWHHAVVVPKNHPLSEGDISLKRLASYPILTYSFGFTGRSNIETAFKNTDMELDIILAAADTDVIKTYVRLGMGVGIIAGMAYDPAMDHDLVARDLSHLIPSSRTKIAYLKNNYLPLYTQHFIDELLVAAKELGVAGREI
ncbi:MAG: LysR family transcriptional regulator [Methylobacter tundripaludum]|mgnify:CR=1 FL=1|uniref:LysR family transcriptional regulator n=1 Tax=Methylobacter tundripaludum TaxID=173365 RepID=A0A2S6GU47_9GAMM|nr:LysR substrate-binding domain-containing protein [Methylobacter tundripaludum]MCF7966057.1 LysR family transcriptional regulator [Methylobacter tundripaludum]PPK68717.1 LysR family transcriptional regulator [Methylobacter tundripaludum]